MTATGAGNTILEVRDLRKHFGKLVVLNGVSFDLHEQEVFVICGPSGSGKSTLIRCINGLEPKDGGTIKLRGTLVDKRNLREATEKIGMVFQNFNLFPHMTALENVVSAPVHVLKRRRAEVVEEARALFEKVGLSDKIQSKPSQLSGGQQQRVAIIRALAMQPDIMLFDEPTSALDPEMIKGVLQVMQQLADDGTTMIVVTHEMSFAREVADRIAFFYEGNFLEVQEPAGFFRNPQQPETRRFLGELVNT